MQTCILSAPSVHRKEPLDLAAIAALRSWVAAYVERRQVKETDIDDIVQEVLLLAIVRQESFDPERSETFALRRWVFGITHTVIITWFRARGYRLRIEAECTAIRRGEHAPSAEGPTTARAMLRMLRASTSEDRWNAWYAYHGQGLTVAEFAAQEGIPANTVYDRIRVAREDFAAALGRQRAIEDGPPIRRR